MRWGCQMRFTCKERDIILQKNEISCHLWRHISLIDLNSSTFQLCHTTIMFAPQSVYNKKEEFFLFSTIFEATMLDRRFDMRAIFIQMTYDGGYNSTKPNFFTLKLLSVCVIHSDQKYNIELFLCQFVLIVWLFFFIWLFLTLGWQTSRSVLNSPLELLATLWRWFVFVFVFIFVFVFVFVFSLSLSLSF